MKKEFELKYFEPTWEESTIVLVDETVVAEAEQYIAGCEQCNDKAEIAFDYLLDELTGCDPTVTEYLVARTPKCPRCAHRITEKTLVVTQHSIK
jgi:hypothetical protein